MGHTLRHFPHEATEFKKKFKPRCAKSCRLHSEGKKKKQKTTNVLPGPSWTSKAAKKLVMWEKVKEGKCSQPVSLVKQLHSI